MSPKPHELEAVQRISEILFDTVDLNELVQVTLRTALEEAKANSGSILLADPERKVLVFRYSLGARPVVAGTEIPWDVGIAGQVFRSGQPALVKDVKSVSHHFTGIDQATGTVTRDMIALPLKRWQGAPVGVLNVINKKGGTFDEADLGVLTVIGSFAAIAIHQAQRAEEARLADVARTLGNIGHDMKNLLTPVVSCAGLLKEELQDIADSDRMEDSQQELCFEAIDAILRTSERIRDRVREIADCVKGRSSPLSLGTCLISDVVQDVFSSLQVLADEAGVKMVMEGLSELPPLTADANRLYTLFYNLVLNALAEVARGGHITVRSEGLKDQAVLVAVSDDGRGMPPDFVARLFTPASTSTKPSGTGLGLRIVKDVIDAHGGQIHVDSTVDQGTTFHLRLPSTCSPA